MLLDRNGFMRIIYFFDLGKCYYMLIDDHDEQDKINLNGAEIRSGNYEKLLGVPIAKKLSFYVHINPCVRKQEKISVDSPEYVVTLL